MSVQEHEIMKIETPGAEVSVKLITPAMTYRLHRSRLRDQTKGPVLVARREEFTRLEDAIAAAMGDAWTQFSAEPMLGLMRAV